MGLEGMRVTISTARFALVTDAAIAVLADLGMRGLTHRAVDARAGLPAGSTSAYFRTRKALIEATVQRLADLDRADTASEGLAAGSTLLTQRLSGDQVDVLAEGVAGVLDRWLSTGRTRTLARYACLLEATHHAELRSILEHGVTFREQARAMVAAAGAPDAERRGELLVAAIDGILFDRLVGAGSISAPTPGSAASRADLAQAVRTLLRAVLGPDR